MPTSIKAEVEHHHHPRPPTIEEKLLAEVALFRRALVWVLSHERQEDPFTLLGYVWINDQGLMVEHAPLDIEILVYAIQRQIDLGAEHAG